MVIYNFVRHSYFDFYLGIFLYCFFFFLLLLLPLLLVLLLVRSTTISFFYIRKHLFNCLVSFCCKLVKLIRLPPNFLTLSCHTRFLEEVVFPFMVIVHVLTTNIWVTHKCLFLKSFLFSNLKIRHFLPLLLLLAL